MERMLAWKSRRAKRSAHGAGWLHEDRPVAHDGWEKVEGHTVPGLAVYLVPDGSEAAAPDAAWTSPESVTARLFPDDDRVPGVDGDRPGDRTVSDQLRFDFDRDPEDPNQHSLIEEPASTLAPD